MGALLPRRGDRETPPGDDTPIVVDLVWRWGLRGAFAARLLVHFLLRPTVVGAHVVVRVGDRVLMVRNSYRRGLGLPAGRVDRGETPVMAACRELREEVGLVCEPGRLRCLGTAVLAHEWMTDHLHVFELVLDAEPPLRPDRREVVWAGFVAEAEIGNRRLQAPTRAWRNGLTASQT